LGLGTNQEIDKRQIKVYSGRHGKKRRKNNSQIH
jgi:hypothetical protein